VGKKRAIAIANTEGSNPEISQTDKKYNTVQLRLKALLRKRKRFNLSSSTSVFWQFHRETWIQVLWQWDYTDEPVQVTMYLQSLESANRKKGQIFAFEALAWRLWDWDSWRLLQSGRQNKKRCTQRTH